MSGGASLGEVPEIFDVEVLRALLSDACRAISFDWVVADGFG